ncbi:beta-glucosidase family protein [Actinomadura fibrosa]|uniref:Beta-glucosidase n=1 Tax=Actinomadura fibrosa TaxID=111802 RepID=A0ABW2XHT9_9ACTN|nr:glycoside hydrolase family 3 N-terminal domain-containing protein [Actinomadura fibrosa]
MPASTLDDDIRTLLSRLSLEQKVAQLGGLMLPDLLAPASDGGEVTYGIDIGRLDVLRPHGVGHLSLAWFAGGDEASLRRNLADVQTGVRERSEGIGAMVHFEAANGPMHDAAPQFPTPWAQAASWDPGLIRAMNEVTASFMESVGVHVVFAPVMDVARDPRWGRTHETYGEDPELVARCSIAFVRGIQGDDDTAPLLATGKHFLGYAVTEGGLNRAATQLGRRALADEYAEPFRRAIAEAGLALVMNSYSEIDGVPAAANRWLLTDLLRTELGFTGTVVSDYDSVKMLQTVHRTAATTAEAAVQAVTAGVDVELPGSETYPALAQEVREGRLDESVIDEAAARVLQTKARLGLLPPRTPSSAPSRPEPTVDREAAAAVRRTMAERAVVLLTNDGTLPLTAGRRRIVVTGPAADELRIHFGAYSAVSTAEMRLGATALRSGEIPGIDPKNYVFTDIFTTRMPGLEPRFEAEARRLHPEAPTLLDALRDEQAHVTHLPFGGFGDDAVLDAAAVRAEVTPDDLVIVAVGERTGWVGPNTAGEGQSTAEPRLRGDQEDLVRVLAETGATVVTVVVSGRPLLLGPVVEASSAVVLAPLLGEEAAAAVTAVLFGRVNPSGKLPSTFPRSHGQVPLYHGQHHGSGLGHHAGYNDLDQQTPLFAFSHGLSYTTFDLKLHTMTSTFDASGRITATVDVSNTGSVAGSTVVQLYARDEVSRVVRPARQLLDFARVTLEPGASATVELSAPAARLAYTGIDDVRRVEAGDVTLMAGFASDDVRAETRITINDDAKEKVS